MSRERALIIAAGVALAYWTGLALLATGAGVLPREVFFAAWILGAALAFVVFVALAVQAGAYRSALRGVLATASAVLGALLLAYWGLVVVVMVGEAMGLSH